MPSWCWIRATWVRICTRSLASRLRQRLVHQERLRVAHDRAAHRHALALAAGEVRRLAVQVLAELEDLGGLLDLRVDLGLGDLRELEREAHVLAHRHVRIQRVVLEDHRDVAIARRELVDALAADDQLAVGDLLQARDHPQRGRLPAARRADEDHELAVADLEVHVLDGLEAVGIALPDVLERDLGHQSRAPGMSVARPGREDEQQPRVAGRLDRVALVRVEHRGAARGAAGGRRARPRRR